MRKKFLKIISTLIFLLFIGGGAVELFTESGPPRATTLDKHKAYECIVHAIKAEVSNNPSSVIKYMTKNCINLIEAGGTDYNIHDYMVRTKYFVGYSVVSQVGLGDSNSNLNTVELNISIRLRPEDQGKSTPYGVNPYIYQMFTVLKQSNSTFKVINLQAPYTSWNPD